MQHAAFGELLKHARRTAGLSQEALAARTGLSARAISDLERKVNRTPRASTMKLLVAALPLSAQEREFFDAAVCGETANPSAPLDSAIVPASSPLIAEGVGPAAGGTADVLPLIGRTNEQTLLERHLEGDGPPLLLFAGEPGIGKTRLLHEAAVRATAHGLQVLHGSVPAVGQHSVRDPLVDALRQDIHKRPLVRLRQDLQGCSWLVRLLPELALGPIETLSPTSLLAEQEDLLTARAVTRFLANVAGPSGVLLTLDNLHHADRASLASLARLVESASDVPLRIVAAYRSSESSARDGLCSVLAMLAHEQRVRHVVLPPLTSGDAAELLIQLIGEGGATFLPSLRGVLDETGGVPFYVTAWAQEFTLRQRAQVDFVPWATRQSITYRIEAGSPALRTVLEAIAVARGRADYPLLVALTLRSPGALSEELEAACRERLIEEDGQVYQFAYGVVRRVVEAELSYGRRLVLRQRLSAAFGRSVRDQPRNDGGLEVSKVNERAYHLDVLRRHRHETSRVEHYVGGSSLSPRSSIID